MKTADKLLPKRTPYDESITSFTRIVCIAFLIVTPVLTLACGTHTASNQPNGLGVSTPAAAGVGNLNVNNAPTVIKFSPGKAAEVVGPNGNSVKNNAANESRPANEPDPSMAGNSVEPEATASPNASFKGCWHKQGGHRYQAVDVSVGTPGKYAFNALLYSGTNCSQYADQFGYGQLIDFGGFGYTFWFTAFPDKSDMSAIWYVGNQQSKCISYKSVPNC